MSSVETANLVADMAGLLQSAGGSLGPTEWTPMTLEEINTFADVTGDHNFLHVDPERAAQTQFGETIAHAYLGLSLLGPVAQRVHMADAATTVNYGRDKVRFPAPLPVGAEWRGTAEIAEVSEIPGGLEAKMPARIEVKGFDRPAVVAESLIRFYS